jgi:GntR family transcriptional regulator, transcriptional repressor for pyruvate dehydrogenase complex
MKDNSFLKPIGNKSIVNTIVERITDSIMRKQLKPGQKIPTELELSESLDVGRNSIREAIKILTALGILEIRRADGTYVSSEFSENMINPLVYSLILAKDSSEDIHELRSLFEVGAVELAIQKADENDIKTLRDMHAEMVLEANKGIVDPSKFIEMDMQFHQYIVKITHNPLIYKISSVIERLTRASQLNTIKFLCETSNMNFISGVHEEIIGLIENKDYANIRTVIHKSHTIWKNNID